MATAKKATPKSTASPKPAAPPKAPAKVVAPKVQALTKNATVAKAAQAIAKINANIGKLTERKEKIGNEIKMLRDQRAALKALPAPVAVLAKVPAKAVTPVKAVKPAAKKK